MNKTLVTVIGFVLFLSGMYGLVLSLVGAKFTMLLFLEKLGPTASFGLKIMMILVGIVLIAYANIRVEEPQAQAEGE